MRVSRRQVYVRDVIRRQQELHDLCTRNAQQAQARQRKIFDKKAAGARAYSVGDYVWVVQNVILPKGTKKLLKKVEGTLHDYGSAPGGTRYNPYSYDFVVDRIDLKKIGEEVVGLEEITVSQNIDIIDDHDEQQQSYEQDLTNLRVLEWLNEMTSDPKETSVTIQDVDRESMKYIKNEREDPSWAAQEGRLLIPASNLDLISGMRSTGTSMDFFFRGVGVGLTHTENLFLKN